MSTRPTGTSLDVLEEIASGYDLARDFDFYNTLFASELIAPHCRDKRVLEVGCATGEMSVELAKQAAALTIVEPSVQYCHRVRTLLPQAEVHACYFEELPAVPRWEVVVLAGLLHHIQDPLAFLAEVARRVTPGGMVLATVPNMQSLHRRLGVAAGMLPDVCGTTERNVRFAQYGRFDKGTFRALFEDAGYTVTDCFGYMLKPFNSEQMMQLHLSMPVLRGLLALGRELEDISSQLFVRAIPPAASRSTQ